MDTFTHIIAGAGIAQLPCSSSPTASSSSSPDFRQRAIIGSVTAIFPDLDYALYYINPLEFIAYWHRAETHSMILLPFWALLITKVWTLRQSLTPHARLIFRICVLSLLSHILLDTLTPYGTQWFAPLSRERFYWDLLFVVDGYFTLTLIIPLAIFGLKNSSLHWRWCLLLPCIYILFIYQVKEIATKNIHSTFKNDVEDLVLLPQPFSPFYWQVIWPDNIETKQAFYSLIDDPIAVTIANLMERHAYVEQVKPLNQLEWQRFSLEPTEPWLKTDAAVAWQQKQFAAYRHFSRYPIFHQITSTNSQICYWFSDLRYHWPGFPPVFPYGICHISENHWSVFRMKYMTDDPVGL